MKLNLKNGQVLLTRAVNAVSCDTSNVAARARASSSSECRGGALGILGDDLVEGGCLMEGEGFPERIDMTGMRGEDERA